MLIFLDFIGSNTNAININIVNIIEQIHNTKAFVVQLRGREE
jgi:hypothetical protein